MKYLIFNKKIFLKATSVHTDYIETIETKNGHVIDERVYLENKELIDDLKLNPTIREINDNEWINESP